MMEYLQANMVLTEQSQTTRVLLEHTSDLQSNQTSSQHTSDAEDSLTSRLLPNSVPDIIHLQRNETLPERSDTDISPENASDMEHFQSNNILPESSSHLENMQSNNELPEHSSDIEHLQTNSVLPEHSQSIQVTAISEYPTNIEHMQNNQVLSEVASEMEHVLTTRVSQEHSEKSFLQMKQVVSKHVMQHLQTKQVLPKNDVENLQTNHILPETSQTIQVSNEHSKTNQVLSNHFLMKHFKADFVLPKLSSDAECLQLNKLLQEHTSESLPTNDVVQKHTCDLQDLSETIHILPEHTPNLNCSQFSDAVGPQELVAVGQSPNDTVLISFLYIVDMLRIS